jgi:ubiquinone/menaquinone biosynthesis C-methylase UbiE
MSKKPNAQYNLAKADSLAVKVATRVRRSMFQMFMSSFEPRHGDNILDVGVTSDQTYSSSNYFEALYPYKDRIVAVGIDDARFLEQMYPGVCFLIANALNLPFSDGSFDYVHSSAVLEHVGSAANQKRVVAECLRVARKGVCLTTPNRWFPVEFHTQLPLVHWLPKPAFRGILRGLGQAELAEEANLNLLTTRELKRFTQDLTDWSFDFASATLLGLNSNILVFAHRRPKA